MYYNLYLFSLKNFSYGYCCSSFKFFDIGTPKSPEIPSDTETYFGFSFKNEKIFTHPIYLFVFSTIKCTTGIRKKK